MCADIECTTPVEAIFDDATCRLHSDIPPIRSYNQTRVSSAFIISRIVQTSVSQTVLIKSPVFIRANLCAQTVFAHHVRVRKLFRHILFPR